MNWYLHPYTKGIALALGHAKYDKSHLDLLTRFSVLNN